MTSCTTFIQRSIASVQDRFLRFLVISACFLLKMSSKLPILWAKERLRLCQAANLLSLIAWLAKPVFLALVMFDWQNCVASAKCNYTEIEVCTADFTLCHCISCINCPAGYGLDPQCGSQVVMQFPQCFKCNPGKTYSQENSTESCNPCPICYGKKILKECNVKQPTNCSDECKDGFGLNPVTGMCEPKSPSTQSVISEIPAVKRSGDIKQPIQESTTKSTPIKHPISTKDNKTIYILLSILVPGAAVLFLMYKRRIFILSCYRRCTETPIRDEEIPLHTRIPESTLLNSISPNLQRGISVKISKRSRGIRGWQDIGYEYGVDQDDLDAMAQAYQSETINPGECLLHKLNTMKPQETLKDFMAVLHKLNRKDIIQIIEKEYSDNVESP